MKRLLVVDDDPNIREVLIQRLRSRGFEVDGAENGVAAKEMIVPGRYAVVLLDLLMPRAAGAEVAEHIESLSPAPAYIIVSGLAKIWRRANPERRPAAVFEKPVAFDTLVDAIRRVVG